MGGNVRTVVSMRYATALVAAFVLVWAVHTRGSQGTGTYVAPQSGWLWVVDSNNYGDEGRILLVDPEGRRVISTLRTGHQPDMVLSSDGTRMYVASSSAEQDRSTLDVIDTATGNVLSRTETPDRWLTTIPIYTSRMALSKDDRYLFQYRTHDTRYQSTYYIATFDTRTMTFLPQTAPVPLCESATLIPTAEPLRVATLCARTQDIRLIDIAPNGSAVRKTPARAIVADGENTGGQVATGFLAGDGQSVTVLAGDGRVTKLDGPQLQVAQKTAIDERSRGVDAAASRSVARTGDTAATAAAANPRDWMAGKRIRAQSGLMSADGTRVYVGVGKTVGPQGGGAFFDEIVALDPSTVARVQSVKPSRQFWSFMAAKDGRRLFAFDTKGGAMLILDAESGTEIAAMPVGATPVFAVPVP